MSFEAFAATCRDELDLAALPKEADFVVADLGLDSLDLLRLSLLLELLHPGVDIPTEIDMENVTIGDVHRLLVETYTR